MYEGEERKNLHSIDPIILKRIDEKRIKDGRSRSNFIEHVLIMRLGEKYTVKRRYIS